MLQQIVLRNDKLTKRKEVNKMIITYDEFEKVDIRVGKITEVLDFPEARKPAYKLTIDFGEEIGIKHSSGQFTKYYKKEDLLGKLILGVVNLPIKQIGPFLSESLTLGVPDSEGSPILVLPENTHAVIGGKLF